MQKREALTGMEAAIVLIAFIIVASVFSCVTLHAGTLATRDGERAVHDGIRTAACGMQVHGSVFGLNLMHQDPERLECFLVPVQLAPGASAVDMSSVSVRITCEASCTELRRADPLMDAMPSYGEWSIQRASNSDGDLLLESGELFLLNISPISNRGYRVNRKITIEITPAGGVPLRVTRMVPGSISRITEME